jgi:hypothetical protein
MERREIAALARVLTIQVRETIAAELRDLKNQVQEVKVYVDQRIQDIKPPLQVEGKPGKDADPVDYVLVAAQIQAEVERRLESSLRAAIAEIPIINGIDGKDADPEVVKAMVLAEIPIPKDGRDAEPVHQDVLVSMVRAAVDEIPRPKDGKDVDMESVRVLVESSVKDALAALPRPKDGKDAAPIDPAIIEEMVIRAVDTIPRPKDGPAGRDAEPVDVQAIISEVVRQIPVPADGNDGQSVDIEQVRQIIVSEVKDAVAAIPVPKDGAPGPQGEMGTAGRDGETGPEGKQGPPGVQGERGERGIDGKDAEPIHPDTIALMVARAFEAMPKPKDGEPGRDGRDALNADILPTIDESKSYPRGTVAKYRGGLWKAIRETQPSEGKSLIETGWENITDGVDIANTRIVQGEDPRIFEFELMSTSGQKASLKAYAPIPTFRGYWKPGEIYMRSEMVQRDGSIWIALKDRPNSQPMMSASGWKSGKPEGDWQLVVKRGADGQPGKDGKEGPPGKPGRDGRDLTQVDFQGNKH